MNKRIFSAAAAFIICSGIALAQDSFPRLDEQDVTGLHIVKETYYDGNSLWGYIDGGADVYLEYGFVKVLARKADANGVHFQIDLYRMTNPASAFGIFSISTFTCSHADTATAFNCSSRFQYQAARGDYYLSVINDKGTEEAGRIGAAIARRLLSRINTHDCELPALFGLAAFNDSSKSVKYIKGRLGIENGCPGWEAFFEGCREFSFYVMSTRADSSDAAIAVITFGDSGDMRNFVDSAGFSSRSHERFQQRETGGTTRCLWPGTDTTCVYLECASSRLHTESLINAITKALAR
jgi:hypothetical protein